MKFYMIEIERGDEFETLLKAETLEEAREEAKTYTDHLTDRERREQEAYIVCPATDWDRWNESIFERATLVEEV